MTPKEKAIDLVTKLENEGLLTKEGAKVCVLIMLDEFLDYNIKVSSGTNPMHLHYSEVKKEVEKL